MKYLLTKEETEILYPGLRDMPIEQPTGEHNPPMNGAANTNWKGGIALDNKAYRARPERKAYDKEYRERPENKAKAKEYYQRPENKRKQKAKEYYKKPEYKVKKREYDREYRQRPEVQEYQKEYQKAYYLRKKAEKLTISTT
tara:strand:- start:60 stop:485 length:426 start_codon:yes stop_codon:yes gene_type:complete